MRSRDQELFAAHLGALPPKASLRLRALVDYLREAADDAVDSVGVASLVAYAHGLYDEHIAPFDIPWVPDQDEPEVIDRPVKWLLKQLIHGAHDLIHTEG